ncbi:unnamed protein product [Cyprideis torosa]|uniref:Uncharacterized protein n=1 Tax=Cyprideis torosa TaxID=163714 RepID=A0A7R8ZRC1_9CRUS|nr:unnamed protein product [Cyprideis torosa]CAG0898540.1 unnamed protein product [Cyprideis torosa]
MMSALSFLSILMLAFTSSVYGDIYDDIQAQVDLLSGENPTQEFEDMVKGLRDIYYYIKYIEVPIAYDRLAFETILNQINQTIIDIEDEYPSANGIPTDISTVLDGSLVLIQHYYNTARQLL